jgi:hypothetical protein
VVERSHTFHSLRCILIMQIAVGEYDGSEDDENPNFLFDKEISVTFR